MAELLLNYFSIDVEFLPENIGTSDSLFEFTMDGEVLPDKRIIVFPGITMLIFTLRTRPPIVGPAPPPAVFQTSPIQWFETVREGPEAGLNSNAPTQTPGMFLVQRLGDTVLTLVDFNSNPFDTDFDKNHWFNLVVTFSDGKTYGSDPVIVNEPPDPPVPDDGRRHQTTDGAARESPRPAVRSRTRGARTRAR